MVCRVLTSQLTLFAVDVGCADGGTSTASPTTLGGAADLVVVVSSVTDAATNERRCDGEPEDWDGPAEVNSGGGVGNRCVGVAAVSGT